MIEKAASIIIASTVAAAASTTTSSVVDLRTYYGATIVLSMTVGSALTTAPTAILEVSEDGSTWTEVERRFGPMPAASYMAWRFNVEPEILYARVKFINGATNTTTIKAVAHVITILG